MTVITSPVAVPRVVLADRDDDQVIATTVAANAVLIVSGDRHLLELASHQGIRIVTPTVALRLIAAL
jgi:predicted nucleic acid-binding protein